MHHSKMNIIEIENSSSVVQYFGHWPSFHDAEVVSMQFDRGEPGYWPIIHIRFQLTDECEIVLLFQNVHEYELDGFNCQNVVSGLRFHKENELIICNLGPCSGLSGNVVAEKVSVQKLILSMTTL